MKTRIVQTIVVVGVIVASVLFLTSSSWDSASRGFVDTAKPLDLSNVKDEIEKLQNRTIVDFTPQGGGVIAYSYLAGAVPDKLDPREVTDMRNETSFTKLIEPPKKEGDNVKLETIFYAQPTFAKDVNGKWRYLEYATTTKTAWDMRDTSVWKRVAEFIVHTAYADTLYTGSGDGYTTGHGHATDLDQGTCEAFVYASRNNQFSQDSTSTTGQFGFYLNSTFDVDITFQWICDSNAWHGFFPFDTSVIPSSAVISSASLNVYLFSISDSLNDGDDYATVMQTTQTTHTTLDSNDHTAMGSTEGISTGSRVDLTGLGTGYSTFTLNATGRGFIAKSGQSSACSATTGITCLGIQEGHDFNNSTFPGNNQNGTGFYLSEQTGTSQDPYLTVAYAIPVNGPSFQIGGNGRFEVGSDGKFEIAPF